MQIKVLITFLFICFAGKYCKAGEIKIQSLSSRSSQSTFSPGCDKNNPEITANIFIHGTIAVGAAMFAFTRFLKDDLMDNNFALSLIKNVQQSKIFRRKMLIPSHKKIDGKLTALQEVDLSNKTEFNDHLHLLVKAYKKIALASSNKENHKLYTYRWNGLLSYKERIKAAQKLYLEMKSLEAKFEKQGKKVKFNLICHSHGGNLGLICGGIHQQLIKKPLPFYLIDTKKIFSQPRKSISKKLRGLFRTIFRMRQRPYKIEIIDEEFKKIADHFGPLKGKVSNLFLLGTPIQIETENFVSSNLFEKVINIYSGGDWVQGSDFLSSGCRRSKQTFDPEFEQKLENLYQIKVKYDLSGSYKYSGWTSNTLHPSHIELYYPSCYRSPFPVVLTLPCLAKQIELLGKECPDQKSLAMTIFNSKGFLEFKLHEDKKYDPLLYLPTFSMKSLSHQALKKKIINLERKLLKQEPLGFLHKLWIGFLCQGPIFNPFSKKINYITQ